MVQEIESSVGRHRIAEVRPNVVGPLRKIQRHKILGAISCRRDLPFFGFYFCLWWEWAAMRLSRPRRQLSLRHRDLNAVRRDPSDAQNAEKNGARKSGKKPGIR